MPEIDDPKGDTEYWTNLLSIYRHSKKKKPPQEGQTELAEIEEDLERPPRSKKTKSVQGRSKQRKREDLEQISEE